MTDHFNRLAIVVVLLALTALLWWLPNALTTRNDPFESEKRHEPDYTIENFTATVMDTHGHRKHELRAARLEHFPDDDTVALDRPYLVQYTPDGPPLHTRADRGFTTTTSKEILMRGNVRVTRGSKAGTPAGAVTAQEMRVLLE